MRLDFFIGVLSLATATALAADGNKLLDFSRDIRPILADSCFRCHGPDAKQRQAGLRLDVRDEALKRLESDAVAIVPGKPEASELVRRVLAADESERMPPAEFKKTLSDQQKALL